MLRDFARKKTVVLQKIELDENELKTVLFELADQFRITALLDPEADPATDFVLWRCVSENEDRTARVADTVDAGFELVAEQCGVINAANGSTGWIDAQPAGVRIQAVGTAVDILVEYTTTARTSWDVNAVP